MLLQRYKLTTLESTDSTQKELHRRFEQNTLQHGEVIAANKQKNAIGRHGRSWVSLDGNLCMSLAVNMAPTARMAELSFVTAVAAGNAIHSLMPQAPLKYKWVNDLMIDNSKVGGVLCQYYEPFMIIGIGINLNHAPALTERKTTSLAEYGTPPALHLLQTQFLSNFMMQYNQWHEDGFSLTREQWLHRAHSIGEEMRIIIGNTTHIGNYQGINEEGNLIIIQENKKIRTISCGEVL